MTAYGEMESAAWSAVELAKELAVGIEDRAKRLDAFERLSKIEDSLVRWAP